MVNSGGLSGTDDLFNDEIITINTMTAIAANPPSPAQKHPLFVLIVRFDIILRLQRLIIARSNSAGLVLGNNHG
jgi:hypothetical protein